MKNHENQSGEPLRIFALRPSRRKSNLIVNQIKKHLPKGSKLILAGNRNTDIVMSGLIRVKRKRGRMKSLLKNDRFSGTSYVPNADLTLNESAFVSIDHLQRRTQQFTWRYHTVESAYDAKHYYHIVMDLLANLLVQERINLVLFFDIPHLFYDTLIYQLAKVKGIRTLIVSRSPFPNRFVSMSEINDFGNLSSAFDDCSSEPYRINPSENPEWEYMKTVKQFRGEPGRLSPRGMLRLFLSLVAIERKKLLNPKVLFSTFSRMRNIAAALPKWRDPYRKHFHTSHLDYYERILLHENDEVDFSRKFVYFPLQYQPEMTTSTLGGCYSDQLLAIEHLSRILPDDSWIYVKENPKQTGAMRGPQFFNRLVRIPNLVFLPSYANTYELIEKSEFVATVTGTVGWEAICKGKIALVFGRAWYCNLPGVIEFREDLTYQMLLDCEVKHNDLEQNTGKLISRSHLGSILPPIKEPTQDDLTESNGVAETIVGLIENRIETTFMPPSIPP